MFSFEEFGGMRKVIISNSQLSNGWNFCHPENDAQKVAWIVKPGQNAHQLFTIVKTVAIRRFKQKRPTVFVVHMLQVKQTFSIFYPWPIGLQIS